MAELRVVRSELILGGPRSGKTSRAEALGAAWLAASPDHRAVYIATARAWDPEMQERLERQRRDRTERIPRMSTVEEPVELARAIGQHSSAQTLIVVDCLTLWLTALLMPAVSLEPDAVGNPSATTIAHAIHACAGPLVLISNEMGPGDGPPRPEVRGFVDALGTINQAAAAACERVTLMSAGMPMVLKGHA